jgi:light-independent protochlorophyllide reductase subunit B
MPSPRRGSRREELGFTVVGLGTYSREFAREVREAAKRYGVER